MSKKSIPWAEARKDILSDPGVNAIYEAELQAERDAEKVTVETLARYAAACGIKNPKIIL